jgi:hypothetical protein
MDMLGKNVEDLHEQMDTHKPSDYEGLQRAVRPPARDRVRGGPGSLCSGSLSANDAASVPMSDRVAMVEA